MKFFLCLLVSTVCFSCGRSEVDVTTGRNKGIQVSRDEVSSPDGRAACNKLFKPYFRLMRSKQELLYRHDGKELVFLDVADSPSEQAETIISYEVKARSMGKYTLPYFAGSFMGIIYVRVNGSEWYELCKKQSSD
jgi:hypothetical protein